MKPTEMNCNYCNQMSESEGHKNCKYKMFDVLKFGIEHEINELQTQLRKLRFDNSILKDENIKLKNDKASLMTENSALKTQILESEKQASQMNYSFEPATIKEEKADLNNAIINSNTDLTSPGSPKTKYISSSTNNNSDILNSESSNDSTGELKTRIKDIPKRKSIPYHNSDSLNKETLLSPSCVQWTMKSDDKKTNTNKENLFPYSFLQPMEKDPLLAKNYDKSALRDDNERLHLSLTSSPKLGLNGRQKVIKKSPKNILRQTILKFPRNLTEMENSILNYCENEDDNENETFCEDLIQPTPGNSTLYRSRSSTRKYSPNKLTNLDINTSALDKKTRESEASVLCVSPSSNAVITIPDSPTIHFESDLKNSFDYGKNTKREQQGLALFGKTSPIRLNAEKAKQPGFDCPDCEKYYGIVGHKLSDAEIQKRLDKCSKHRKNIRYHETPSGFWNPKFTPTQNSMN